MYHYIYGMLINGDCLEYLKKIESKNWETNFYIDFIEKFYYDNKFNELYINWIITKDKWKKPSIDHIDSKNRKNDLSNFQFLTWFENRSKNNIPNNIWIKMKENINEYFI